jgi:hypothetical protein
MEIKENIGQSDIEKLLMYMWEDEKKHFEECGCPNDHIFNTLKRIRDAFGLSKLFHNEFTE